MTNLPAVTEPAFLISQVFIATWVGMFRSTP